MGGPAVEGGGRGKRRAACSTSSSRSIKPKSFYGVHWKRKVPRVRLEFFKSCWQREKKRERDEGEEGDEDSVWSDPFKCFARQQDMFAWSDAVVSGGERERFCPSYFTFETNQGKRKFLATSIRRFWRLYSVTPSYARHYYELIRENAPCKMYYDLEFAKRNNPGHTNEDGDAMVDLVVELTCEEIFQRFGLKISADAIVELDSSTEAKFSRHLTIPLPGKRALASNAHAGAIAAAVVGRIYEKKLGEGEEEEEEDQRKYSKLLVRGSGEESEEKLVPFIDLSVYSRNRSFRIFKSSKCGKGVELKPTGRYCGRLEDSKLFLESLICHFDDSEAALGVVGGAGQILSCDEVLKAAADAQTFKPLRALGKAKGNTSAPKVEEGDGHHEKFPLLTSFIHSMKSPDGMPMYIRSYVKFPESQTVILNVAGNRYCQNINRQHKSNGVFLVVDVQMGHVYQKCYDPECKHFRGDAKPLPLDVMMELSCDSVDENADKEEEGGGGESEPAEVEDESFFKAIDELEKVREQHLF